MEIQIMHSASFIISVTWLLSTNSPSARAASVKDTVPRYTKKSTATCERAASYTYVIVVDQMVFVALEPVDGGGHDAGDRGVPHEVDDEDEEQEPALVDGEGMEVVGDHAQHQERTQLAEVAAEAQRLLYERTRG